MADNGAVVDELDENGLICSTIVMEGDDMPAKLGKLIIDYIDKSDCFGNFFHIVMKVN